MNTYALAFRADNGWVLLPSSTAALALRKSGTRTHASVRIYYIGVVDSAAQLQ
jgi:hypothetical protein